MPRAKTKAELITQSNDNFTSLWHIIDKLTEKELNTEFDFTNNPKLTETHWQRDKNLRDILVHLHEWHLLLIKWITTNQQTTDKYKNYVSLLPEPYNWKTYPQMNIEFWQKHQKTPLDKAINLLKDSHQQVMKLIEDYSNEELFTKKHFAWTGTTNLASYCISATASHYDWAIKKIRKHKKNIATL